MSIMCHLAVTHLSWGLLGQWQSTGRLEGRHYHSVLPRLGQSSGMQECPWHYTSVSFWEDLRFNPFTYWTEWLHSSWPRQGGSSISLWIAYVDLKSAFDSVDRSVLWRLLISLGSQKVVDLLKDLFINTVSAVSAACNGGLLSEWFQVNTGVRDVVSPLTCSLHQWIPLWKIKQFTVALQGQRFHGPRLCRWRGRSGWDARNNYPFSGYSQWRDTLIRPRGQLVQD